MILMQTLLFGIFLLTILKIKQQWGFMQLSVEKIKPWLTLKY